MIVRLLPRAENNMQEGPQKIVFTSISNYVWKLNHVLGFRNIKRIELILEAIIVTKNYLLVALNKLALEKILLPPSQAKSRISL
jgi:hypothetical protein